ncbi:MAG: LysR family transcriptional regulator [Pseudomonadota bacterium]
MDWKAVTFDWNRARAFLVTAEEGSLSAAARSLKISQPTLGRQVSALEEELGIALFERVGNRLVLTQGGMELVEHARAMGDAAMRVALAASGQAQSIEGHVCISATDVAAVFVLPPIIARMRAALPGLTIEVVATNSNSDLRRREADIAIRGARPTDPDLVARRVLSLTARLYASHAYLEAVGPLDTPEALSAADFIGGAENAGLIGWLNAQGLSLGAESFRTLSATHLAQWAFCKAGLGVCASPRLVGDAEPGVAPAAPWLPEMPFEIWLVAHREVNTSRRIRLVFDRLAEELTAL